MFFVIEIKIVLNSVKYIVFEIVFLVILAIRVCPNLQNCQITITSLSL